MNGSDESPQPAPELPPKPAAANAPAIPPPPPLFQPNDWRAFWITTAVVLVIYLVTLAPEVTMVDSGMYSVGAMYAGVPHPPGFPLWTLYAWTFTHLLALSNIAWRVAVSSAVAAALTCGVVALMVSRGGAMALDCLNCIRRLPATEENWLRVVCGFVAGIGFGLQRAFWARAVIVETTALAVLLLAVVLCLLLRWVYVPEYHRYLYVAVFIYGLALTVNISLAAAAPALPFILLFVRPSLGRDVFFAIALIVGTVLLSHLIGFRLLAAPYGDPFWPVGFLIGIVAFLISGVAVILTRGLLTQWRCLCWFGVLLSLSLSLYFYVAVASMTNPPMNWGYPRTVEGFWHTLTRGQYEPPSPAQDIGRLTIVLVEYLRQTGKDLGWVYFAPALIPFWFLRRMRAPARNWLLGLLVAFACMSLINIAVLNASERGLMDFVSQYFPASQLGLVLWAGYGLCLLGTLLGHLGKSAQMRAP